MRLFYGLVPVFKREVRALLQSPGVYVALGLLFLVGGAVYHDILVEFGRTSEAARKGIDDAPNVTLGVVEPTFLTLAGLFMFAAPALTMGAIAGEKSAGTFETLVACPVGDWGILLGKFLALLALGAAMIALSSIYPLTTALLGRRWDASPEFAVVLACDVGLLLVFASYAAFGIMVSSATRNRMTAAIATLAGLLLWNMLGELPVAHPGAEEALRRLSASRHTEPFVAGAIAGDDVFFFLAATFFFLFVAARILESRRWRA